MTDDEFPANLDKIHAPDSVPRDTPDDRSAAEMDVAEKMAKLKPTDRNIHLSERLLMAAEDERNRLLAVKETLVERSNLLWQQKDSLHERICRLAEENARLLQSHRSMRFSLAVASLAFAIGGSAISQFAASAVNEKWSYLGWGLVLCASVFLFVKSAFDA